LITFGKSKLKNSMKKSVIILFGIVLIVTSCAPRIPFTQTLREQYKLKDNELRSLQFYASHNIVLNRGERSDKEQTTEEGTLTIKSGNYVEQVIIKAGTPGVVEKVLDRNRIAVSFEIGENKYLEFGATNPKVNSRYTLLAPKWVNNKGEIQYGGKTYYSSSGSGNVYLMFKMRKLHRYSKEQRVVKGRKI